MNKRREQENFILCPPGRCPWLFPPPPPHRPPWGPNDWGCPNCGPNHWDRKRFDGDWHDDRNRRDWHDDRDRRDHRDRRY